MKHAFSIQEGSEFDFNGIHILYIYIRLLAVVYYILERSHCEEVNPIMDNNV